MQDKTAEKEHFDAFTESAPWNAFTNGTYKRIVKLFSCTIKPKKNAVIIDIGCGTGELANALHNEGYTNIKGIDISPNCIATAKKQFPHVAFDIGEAEKTRQKPSSVDVLIYCGVLHHFEDMGGALKEAKRILRKNGKLFFFEPNARNPVLWAFRDEQSPLKSTKLKTPNEKFFTVGTMRHSLQKSNMGIMEIGCVSNIHYSLDHFKKLFPFPLYYLVHPYNIFDSALNMTPLKKGYGSFIYGAAKKN